MKKTILITGATSGFGKAIALKFAENGHALIITGRRKDRIDKIADEIWCQFKVSVLPLCFDVRKLKECEEAIQTLPEEWKKINSHAFCDRIHCKF